MKKVGIVTIIDNNNYGNRLQNYALNYYLKNKGLSVLTINNSKLNLLKSIKKYIRNIYTKLKYHNTFLRERNFKLFNKNIDFTKYVVKSYNDNKKLDSDFDYFIVGSDQVWNPLFDRLSKLDVLSFASKEKRISYAASFGISDIPKENLNLLDNIAEFKSISVRENRGKEIIKDATGRDDVAVLIDPTLLLTSSDWDMVTRKPEKLKSKKYILNYFLGELSCNRRNEIERVARENDCDIINILDKNDPMYTSGPAEFLYLEKNAFLICTDSFHSSVFAILYNRPFIVFERDDKEEKMNSRLDTLLETFMLEDRKYNGEKIDNNYLNCDYRTTNKILDEKRMESYEFLNNSLDFSRKE